MGQLNHADYQPLSNCEKRIFMRIGGTDVGQTFGTAWDNAKTCIPTSYEANFCVCPKLFHHVFAGKWDN
jgi:hypothetical protein